MQQLMFTHCLGADRQ